MNNCPVCKKQPKVEELVSCRIESCSEFGKEHFVWEWNLLPVDDKAVDELTMIEGVYIKCMTG